MKYILILLILLTGCQHKAGTSPLNKVLSIEKGPDKPYVRHDFLVIRQRFERNISVKEYLCAKNTTESFKDCLGNDFILIFAEHWLEHGGNFDVNRDRVVNYVDFNILIGE